MARFLILCITCLSLSMFSLPHQSYAQNQGDGEQQTMTGPRQQLATIIFAGLAGAILGLSTLSFYGRPQDKLSNIAIGFAVGVISGTVYTTYKAATRPYGDYQEEANWNVHKSFSLAEHKPTPKLQWQWEF